MRITRYHITATLLGLALIPIMGCDYSTGPITRGIRVTVSTAGANGDVDTDGYALTVDGGPMVGVGANTTFTISGLQPGNHLVRLDGVAPNCSVSGTNPRPVEITADDKATPVAVFFSVSCIQKTGSIQITTETSGPDPDTDGYSVVLGGVRVDVPANGTRSIAGIREGQYAVTLTSVSGNCSVDGPPRIVNIPFDATVEVALVIRCVPAGALQVTIATTGVDVDPDGYAMDVRLQGASSSARTTIGTNGTVTLPALRPGTYLLTILDMMPNCDLASPGPRTVVVGEGSATPLALDVTCVAPTQIAFVNPFGNSEIQVIRSNGTGHAQLTFEVADDVNPAWSPDGNRIAFASRRDGNSEIYVMNANGTSPTRLTNHAAADSSAASAPDGARIAFVSGRDGGGEIYVMNADGTNPTRLTNHEAIDAEPASSPDGSSIAFETERDGVRGIWVMNADGSAPRRLTTNGFGDRQPAWSPDGTRIAFSRGLSSGKSAIFVIKANGSGLTQLTQVDDASDPAWSPDGRKIAFTAVACAGGFYYYDCGPFIKVVGTDGILYSLTIGAEASQPAWRP